MKVRMLAPSAVSITLNDGRAFLVSYSNIVAARTVDGHVFRCSEFLSPTTSRHMAAWLKGKPAKGVGLDELAALAAEV